MISEVGKTSVGRQLISIAEQFCKQDLVLDEATSSVDTRTESNIQSVRVN